MQQIALNLERNCTKVNTSTHGKNEIDGASPSPENGQKKSKQDFMAVFYCLFINSGYSRLGIIDNRD